MSLETRNLKAFKKKSKMPSVSNDPMSFGRELRVVNKIYHESDRDVQAFLRKMMIIRLNESKGMMKSPQYTKEEKEIIKSNQLALDDMWKRWNEEMAVYEN